MMPADCYQSVDAIQVPSLASAPSSWRADCPFSTMTRRFRPLVFLSLLSLLVQACTRSEAEPVAPPPPTVTVVAVTPETVPVTAEWVATLDGYVNAQIRPQVSGYLTRRNYREGAAVRKDEVLFEIDPR